MKYLTKDEISRVLVPIDNKKDDSESNRLASESNPQSLFGLPNTIPQNDYLKPLSVSCIPNIDIRCKAYRIPW